MGRKRKRGGVGEDQYGEVKGEDYGDRLNASMSGGGMRGGGSAGGASRRGAARCITYERQVPKFLQEYAHLMDPQKNPFQSRHTTMAEADDAKIGLESREDNEDEFDDGGALQRAFEDNPEIAKEFGKDALNKAKAVELKEEGNSAFSSKEFKKAENLFTQCIELDPRNEVYFSNRSAARLSQGDCEGALSDGRSVVQLNNKWPKGYSRMAAAYMALNQPSHAREAYECASKLDPDDHNIQNGLQQADALERKQSRDRKHTFVRQEHKSKSQPDHTPFRSQQHKKNQNILSFADEDEDEHEEEVDRTKRKR
eukprot:TRINITY_DN7208_c1_g1_i1.p1 TRINITY_DN7208_c1_g1~~TRINITY_DN7208_c1_g1_i1.p1  ORF type:complete len:335 (+),score=74.98 TRINITY_DN7208_c1_g1_i1:75-1007(+)